MVLVIDRFVSRGEDIRLARINFALDPTNDPVTRACLHHTLKGFDATPALSIRGNGSVVAGGDKPIRRGISRIPSKRLDDDRLLSKFWHRSLVPRECGALAGAFPAPLVGDNPSTVGIADHGCKPAPP